MFKHHKTLLVLLLIGGGLIVLKMTDMGENLTLANVQASAARLKEHAHSHYTASVFVFIAVYALLNLWIPAAAVLTLLAGFIFGTLPATLYVLTATTLGALLGFWVSRHILGHWVQRRWHHQLVGLNNQIEKHGYMYLVFVRMIPMMPYTLINYLAGLSKVRPRTLAWTTAAGSLPGIIVFTYAGGQLLAIRSVDDVLTPKAVIALSLLFVFSLVVIMLKIFMDRNKKADPPAAVSQPA